MRKIFALLLTAVLTAAVFSSLIIPASATAYDINEDFESFSAGPFSGAPKIQSVNIVNPAYGKNNIVVLEDGNHVLQLHHPYDPDDDQTGGYDNFIRVSFSDVKYSDIVVEYDVMIEEPQGDPMRVWYDNAKTDLNEWVIPFEIDADSYMYVAGQDVGDYTFGEWIHIAVRYNFNEGYFIGYVNNKPVTKEIAEVKLNDGNSFQYYNIGYTNNLKMTVDAYIDNVRVYNAEVPEGVDPDAEVTTVEEFFVVDDDDTTAAKNTEKDTPTEPVDSETAEAPTTTANHYTFVYVACGVVLVAAITVIVDALKKK